MKWLMLILIILFVILLGFMGIVKLILFVNGGAEKSEPTSKIVTQIPTPTKNILMSEKIINKLNKDFYGKEYIEIMNQITDMDSTTTLLGCEKKDGLFGATWTDTFKCSDGSTFKVIKRQDKNKNYILVEAL
jgi:hypothetical protein